MRGKIAIALALALASVTEYPLHAQSIKLAPVKDFDLQSCLPAEPVIVSQAFVVTAKGLYFLVSPPYTSAAVSQYIVKTDFNGACAGTITLSEHVSPLWLSVNSDTFSVLKRYSTVRLKG